MPAHHAELVVHGLQGVGRVTTQESPCSLSAFLLPYSMAFARHFTLLHLLSHRQEEGTYSCYQTSLLYYNLF